MKSPACRSEATFPVGLHARTDIARETLIDLSTMHPLSTFFVIGAFNSFSLRSSPPLGLVIQCPLRVTWVIGVLHWKVGIEIGWERLKEMSGMQCHIFRFTTPFA
ncbi:hypothetical protein JTB14_015290 [Gonioctena quinquepunctata]|nr:hypothetical protein JTB14_015290 [Gonioctena quinquepunctata]